MAAAKKSTATVKSEITIAAAEKLTPQSVQSNVLKFQEKVREWSSDLTAAVLQGLTELDSVKEAIRLKREELAAVHELGTEGESLEDRIAQVKQELEALEGQKADLTIEFVKANEDHDNRMNQLEFDHQLAEKKFDVEAAEKAEARRKQMAEIEKTHLDRLATINGEIETKRKELAEKEKQVVAFEATVNHEIEQGITEVRQGLDQEIYKLKMELDTQKRISSEQLQAAQTNQLLLKSQLDETKQQLLVALATVQEMGKKAMEAGSGREAMTAMRQTISEAAAGNGETGGRRK